MGYMGKLCEIWGCLGGGGAATSPWLMGTMGFVGFMPI